MQSLTPTRRFFTQAARDAAALTRLRKREARLEAAKGLNIWSVVLRADEPSNRFRWEIRRYGALDPVRASDGCYESSAQARAAARAAQKIIEADPRAYGLGQTALHGESPG